MLKADGAKFLGLRSIESTTELSAAKSKKHHIQKHLRNHWKESWKTYYTNLGHTDGLLNSIENPVDLIDKTPIKRTITTANR